jgi:hypothetical protein
LVTVIAAVLRVGFYFIDEEGRLARTKKRITQAEAGAEADRREHTVQ